MVITNQLRVFLRIAAGLLLLVCAVSSFSFAGDHSQQATLHHRSPGICPSAFPSCIYYGGDSDWNVTGGNISYLPVSGLGSFGSRVFDNAEFTSAQTVTGIFANVLVDPSELPLYTTGYWEVRSGVSEGNIGTLIASGTCGGSDFNASLNGQDANSNKGVWFSCNLPSVSLAPGTYWFSLVPQATGATKQIFEWTTSIDPPPVGTRQEFCDGYVVKPSCAYYDSSFYGFGSENTLDTSPALPYPTAGGASGAFSWGLY